MGKIRGIAAILKAPTLNCQSFTLAPPVSTKKYRQFYARILVQRKTNLSRFSARPHWPLFRPLRRPPQGSRLFRPWGQRHFRKRLPVQLFFDGSRNQECRQLRESLLDAFLDLYLLNTRTAGKYSPRGDARRMLKLLLRYLAEIRAYRPSQPKPIRKPYSWVLDPYLQHLRRECELAEVTIQRSHVQVGSFLESLGSKVRRPHLKSLRAETIEGYIKRHLKDSPENLQVLAATLRRFFRFCALHRYMRTDFSGLIPPVRRYRHASLPKGIEDSALERVLGAIDRNTPNGARDYAIMVLMMAYGLRGVSVAELLLDDLDWQNSRIRIRAQKGGKEVVLPLMDSVGDALVRYLRHRFNKTPFREVFLTVKAPVRPLYSVVVSRIVRNYMQKAGITMAGAGSRTLRHSWAIRALANDSPIKSIADVLGHRYIDTTFIYAKADLKTLRAAAMPWPEKG